jgi:dienelactone hydrolase
MQSVNGAVQIQSDHVVLDGDLSIPAGANSIVVFAHGSGSSRHSPRNQRVAQIINQAGMATLLLDLFSHKEEQVDRSHHLRFNIELLSQRLLDATDWVRKDYWTKGLRIGYFGASTGAAAALVAAAQLGAAIGAVVSRGGRPDLAEPALARVVSPTLLIVGELDVEVLLLNREAFEKLRCEKEIKVLAGATHLFEEPGALDEVAALATEWFKRHLAEFSDRNSGRRETG